MALSKKKKVVSNQSKFFLWQGNCPVDKGKAIDLIYLDISKDFHTVPFGTVINKLQRNTVPQ